MLNRGSAPLLKELKPRNVKQLDDGAQEIDAGLVVCGQRGRGPVGSALLGSVSHALAAHTKRPVLIAPQHLS